MRQALFALVALAILVSDQLTKYWITRTLPMGSSVPVCPPVLYLLHATNDGVAWSLFRRHTEVFSVVAVVFCVGILYWGRSLVKRSTFMAVVMGLLLGGSLGNLVDRIRLRYVVDFIDVHIGHWYQWPTFNVADSAITTGMILLAGYFMVFESRLQETRAHDARTQDPALDAAFFPNNPISQQPDNPSTQLPTYPTAHHAGEEEL